MLTTQILTPRQLFQKDVHYTIPEFQRPYVWSQEEQWEPLWSDLQNVAEDYLEQRAETADAVEAQAKTKPHFLGAIVMQQVPTPAKDIERREVIDGQQRITTIQLLLDAAQEVLQDLKVRPAARRLEKYVLNDKDLVEDAPEQRFKLSPTRGDRESFRHAMDNGLAASDFKDALIVQAHEFFKGQVKQWLEKGPAPAEQMVEALETAVTSMFEMVVIDLGLEDDANIIFETLNARGTPLEQSDLIKNYVLSQLPRNDPQGPLMWEGLDDPWWRETVRQGRLTRLRLDMLLNFWLAMRTGKEITAPNVFQEFRKEYPDDIDIFPVMADVQKDLGNYRVFVEGPRSVDIETFYYRMDVMQVGVFTPAILLLLSADIDSQVRAFNALESFLVRRMVRRQTTKDYNGLALQLANRLRTGGLANAARTVIGYLREQEADAREWPTDSAVSESFSSLPLYRLLTRGRLRLVLEGIEMTLRKETGVEQIEPPKNLTIEHFLPIDWQEHWPLTSNYDSEERNRILHTIGNLTLLDQGRNSKLSNRAWDEKKGELQDSVMQLTRGVLNKAEWSEDKITERGRQLADAFAKHWPGPQSRVWD